MDKILNEMHRYVVGILGHAWTIVSGSEGRKGTKHYICSLETINKPLYDNSTIADTRTNRFWKT